MNIVERATSHCRTAPGLARANQKRPPVSLKHITTRTGIAFWNFFVIIGLSIASVIAAE